MKKSQKSKGDTSLYFLNGTHKIKGCVPFRISPLLMFIVINFCVLSFFVSVSSAEKISSKELINDAKSFDGKAVVYAGEAVTQVLNRGAYSWIALNDGYNTIGIWCKSASADSVKFVGDYKNRGDYIEVKGIFNRACPIHGGELDIHAEEITVVKTGYLVEEKLSAKRTALAIALFLFTIPVAIIFRKRT